MASGGWNFHYYLFLFYLIVIMPLKQSNLTTDKSGQISHQKVSRLSQIDTDLALFVVSSLKSLIDEDFREGRFCEAVSRSVSLSDRFWEHLIAETFFQQGIRWFR